MPAKLADSQDSTSGNPVFKALQGLGQIGLSYTISKLLSFEA